MKDQTKIVVKFKHVVFYNEENHYAVVKFLTKEYREQEIVAVGHFLELQKDMMYTLYGEYYDHYHYGMQFHVSAYEIAPIDDDETLIRYFSSAIFKGVGRSCAKLIVETLGLDAIEKIKKDPEVLDHVPSLSEVRKQRVLEGVMQHQDMDHPMVFFTQFGFGSKHIQKIIGKYGERAVEMVKENPYHLMEDIEGIGFKVVDKVAKNLSVDVSDPIRLEALVLAAVFETSFSSGNSYVNADIISNYIEQYYHQYFDVIPHVESLCIRKQLYVEGERIYHHSQYLAENGIAFFFKGFPMQELPLLDINFETAIEECEKKYCIKYEKQQKEAIETYFKSPFSIVNGGPGTGKSTIVRGILDLTKKYYPNLKIALCAPTGRASKRLKELGAQDAITIHSMLKWDLETNTFLINEKEPLHYDILIIDEFSMVDQWLFHSILKASGLICRILVIGDEEQLPSVNIGCVLKDLIQCKSFPLTKLEKIFRQEEGSDVIFLAQQIQQECLHEIHNCEDVKFINSNVVEAKDKIIDIVERSLNQGFDAKDIQVLSPMYHGNIGINALNAYLQNVCNPKTEFKKEIPYGKRCFRISDKVLQLKNQVEDGIYNGDIGIIIDIIIATEDVRRKNKIIVDFDGIEVEYQGEQFKNITHAYCISIHKSQGSEYPIVIMPIFKEYSYMLEKRLLYTGITRAKKKLFLVGDEDLFFESVRIKNKHVRLTTLCERLCLCLNKH